MGVGGTLDEVEVDEGLVDKRRTWPLRVCCVRVDKHCSGMARCSTGLLRSGTGWARALDWRTGLADKKAS